MLLLLEWGGKGGLWLVGWLGLMGKWEGEGVWMGGDGGSLCWVVCSVKEGGITVIVVDRGLTTCLGVEKADGDRIV